MKNDVQDFVKMNMRLFFIRLNVLMQCKIYKQSNIPNNKHDLVMLLKKFDITWIVNLNPTCQRPLKPNPLFSFVLKKMKLFRLILHFVVKIQKILYAFIVKNRNKKRQNV